MRKFTISGIYETSLEEFDKMYVFCDIGHIKRLNGWRDDQVSGFEIFINDPDKHNILISIQYHGLVLTVQTSDINPGGLSVKQVFNVVSGFKISIIDIDQLNYMTQAVRDAVGYRITEDEEKFKVINIREKYPQIFDWLNFQDVNVIIIIFLMLVVAGFNMISGLLILILEKTNMIGILKALGSDDITIRRVFIYQAAYLIGKGLFWGNLIGIGLAFLQLKTGLITLDPSSYYIKTVPVNLDLIHILLLNAGTMAAILIMMLVPSKLISRITPVKAIRYD
ncbi:MAG: FtsX-like permease family protein [Bacteroidia bacterium]|nr:FtsX-like permease family protein [Bacteroidia bacterium]